MIDIEKLKAAAEELLGHTAGRWPDLESGYFDVSCQDAQCEDWHNGAEYRYLALMSPDAALELIAELKAHRENPNIRAIQSLRGDVADLKAENEALRAKIDRLLDHCPDGECATCGEIICPHGGAMHFHHDGCPSCAEHEGDSHD